MSKNIGFADSLQPFNGTLCACTYIRAQTDVHAQGQSGTIEIVTNITSKPAHLFHCCTHMSTNIKAVTQGYTEKCKQV